MSDDVAGAGSVKGTGRGGVTVTTMGGDGGPGLTIGGIGTEIEIGDTRGGRGVTEIGAGAGTVIIFGL